MRRIAQFLTVIHPTQHTIYLSRHGQSEYNVLGKIGGNPPLSPAGQALTRSGLHELQVTQEYAARLGEWVAQVTSYTSYESQVRHKLQVMLQHRARGNKGGCKR